MYYCLPSTVCPQLLFALNCLPSTNTIGNTTSGEVKILTGQKKEDTNAHFEKSFFVGGSSAGQGGGSSSTQGRVHLDEKNGVSVVASEARLLRYGEYLGEGPLLQLARDKVCTTGFGLSNVWPLDCLPASTVCLSQLFALN